MMSFPADGAEEGASAKAVPARLVTDQDGKKGPKMKWVITIETKEEEHSHIDVDDPDTAAVVINEINDARAKEGKRPAHARLDSYTEWWKCQVCGATELATGS